MDKNKKLFPQRLWELIHDEKYNFCLRWSPDGQRVYLNRNDFEIHYLRTPNNQFHTQKAISFVRQMNMYGFRKVDDCYYENDNFKRNGLHLLKNMVRRHSSKSVFSPVSEQNSHNQNIQQQQITGAHSRPPLLQHPHRHQRDQLNYQAVYKPSQSAEARSLMNSDIDRQAAQFNRGGANSVGNIGAAIAAIDFSTTRSPLASTLYHRLTASNFNQPDVGNSISQQRQFEFSSAQVSPIDPIDLVQQRTNSIALLQQTALAAQHQSQFDTINIPLECQQTLAARQALQESLVRTLLQLKQPQPSRLEKQNLITSIQQQNPSLLIESLANWNSLVPNSLLNQLSTSPLELVVNSAPRLRNELQFNNQFQQIQLDNNSLLDMLTTRSNMIINNANSALDNMEDDEDELDDEDCMIDFEDDLFSRNCSIMADSRPSSSTHERN